MPFDFDIGVAMMSSYDDDGFLSTQVDVPGEAKAQVHPYENHFPYGIYARPLDAILDKNQNPDPSKANQVFYALEGGTGHAWPLENPSVIGLLPTLLQGETLFYGPKGQFIKGAADGSFAGWTPGASGDDEPAFSFGPNGLSFSCTFGKLQIDETGARLVHSPTGASLELGATGGVPAPLNAITSRATVTAGSFDADCSSVSLGPSSDLGSIPSSVPSGIFLLAELTAIKAALTAIGTALTAGGTGGGPAPVVLPGAPAAMTAIQAVLLPSPTLLYTTAFAMF